MVKYYSFSTSQIKDQIEKVISYSQNLPISELNTTNLIYKWQQNKDFFIDKMGGLIYETDHHVQFELSEKEKNSQKDKFLFLVDRYYNLSSLIYYIDKLSTQEFFENRTSKDYHIRGIFIPKNMKVVKSFKYFIESKEVLEKIQNEASRIIQDNIISGTLCLSVHPLDFLSASENNCGWRSCHALDGDYRSGNLSFMVDKTTVVCYLKSDGQEKLPRFSDDVPWNSKKWRTFLFFSNDKNLIFAGRQYPFLSLEGLDLIKNILLPEAGFGSDWTSWQQDEYIYKNKKIVHIVNDNPLTYHFNDILSSTVYKPLWTKTSNISAKTAINMGDAAPCPVCGEKFVEYAGLMLCKECAKKYQDIYDNFFECEICGSMVHIDDLWQLSFSHTQVCNSCYNTELVQCDSCGISDLPCYIVWREDEQERLCPDCYDTKKKGIINYYGKRNLS